MRIIIQGAGRVGSHLAKMLRGAGHEIAVIDDDEKRLNRLSSEVDIRAINGNPSSARVLVDARVPGSDLYIAVYPSTMQEMNIVGGLLAKHLGAAKVIARVNDEEYLSEENLHFFNELGIELLFYPERVAAEEIVAQLKRASSSESMDFAKGQLQVSVFKLNEESPLLDLSLMEFVRQFTKEQLEQFRIIAVSRGDRTIIPKPDTVFMYNDIIFTFSKKEGIDLLTKYFGRSNLEVRNVMIIGGNEVAEMLAASLHKLKIGVKLAEIDHERAIKLNDVLDDEIQVVNGDGRDSDFLYDEGITTYDAFVALTGRDESNILSCVIAKKFGVQRTVAEVENTEYVRLAEEMGIDCVINKKLLTAANIYRLTLEGEAKIVKNIRGTDAEVIEYTATTRSLITQKPIKDLKFPEGAIIGGVIRGEDAFIAVGDTQIMPGDRVDVFAVPESIKAVDKFFK